MKMQGSGLSILVAVGLAAALASPVAAQAQDNRAHLVVGYSFLKADGGNLSGLRLSPEFRLKGFAALVADLSVEKGTISKTSTTLSTFLGGLRLKRGIGSSAVFIHALGGGVRTSSTVQPFSGVSISVSDTGLGLDGGGGIEFKFRGALKMRLGADYLRRKVGVGGGKTKDENDIRASVGFVF